MALIVDIIAFSSWIAFVLTAGCIYCQKPKSQDCLSWLTIAPNVVLVVSLLMIGLKANTE